MLVKPRITCEGCIKPVARRLALFQAKDEYECYAESYVKCFWGLCDLHRSESNLVPTRISHIITEQPRAQGIPFKDINRHHDVFVKN